MRRGMMGLIMQMACPLSRMCGNTLREDRDLRVRHDDKHAAVPEYAMRWHLVAQETRGNRFTSFVPHALSQGEPSSSRVWWACLS